MKKIILFIAIMFSTTAFAQLVQFGPQVSSNTTMVRSHDLADHASGTSVNYGGFLRFNILLLYVQGELGYAQSKFSISQDGTSNTEYKLSGTDAAVLVGFKVVPLGKLGNVRVFGGYDWKNFSSTDTDNDLNHFDVASNNHSFIIGAGVDLWKFTLDYKFLNGLSNIDNSGGDTKLNASCFSLGFKF